MTAACLSTQCTVLPSLHFDCDCCLQRSYIVLRTNASAYTAGYQIITSKSIEECCLHYVCVWSNSPLNENSSLPQNFPTAFAILLLLVLVPNPSLLFHSVCVCFFFVFFYAFFSCKEVCGCRCWTSPIQCQKISLFSELQQSYYNLRGISWSKKENYVCWHSSLCLLPQQILWPRDVHG